MTTESQQQIKINFENEKENLIRTMRENCKVEMTGWDSEGEFALCEIEMFGKKASLTLQNGDMNGGRKGQAVWNNEGADSGLDDLLEILKEWGPAKKFIEHEECWKYEYLKELRDIFIETLDEEFDFDQYIF